VHSVHHAHAGGILLHEDCDCCCCWLVDDWCAATDRHFVVDSLIAVYINYVRKLCYLHFLQHAITRPSWLRKYVDWTHFGRWGVVSVLKWKHWNIIHLINWIFIYLSTTPISGVIFAFINKEFTFDNTVSIQRTYSFVRLRMNIGIIIINFYYLSILLVCFEISKIWFVYLYVLLLLLLLFLFLIIKYYY